ncbi:MAG: HAD-IIA family hydrolase [Anaerolineaceae bacterium]|jgi:4-nitrophenyl phosphatase
MSLRDRFPQLKGVILDMDGVLWKDTEPIGDLPFIFDNLTTLGLDYMAVTNNAMRTVEDYVIKFRSLGVEIDPYHIMGSADATALYLSRHFSRDLPLYVVGTDSLKARLMAEGFLIAPVEEKQRAGAVVVGLDHGLTYQKIANAGLLIQAGVPFIASNTDATFPMPDGLYPGAGTVVAAVMTAGGREPLVIGKPSPYMYLEALNRMNLQPFEAMGIGDRLETDIAGAQAAGCLSGLVLSGVTNPQQLQKWEPKPDIVAPDLTQLLYG